MIRLKDQGHPHEFDGIYRCYFRHDRSSARAYAVITVSAFGVKRAMRRGLGAFRSDLKKNPGTRPELLPPLRGQPDPERNTYPR